MNKKLAKEFLFDLIDIFEKFNIKYAVFAGVFLGAIREKDFIQWDNDIDIAVFEQFWNNYEKMDKIINELSKKNMFIINLWNLISITIRKEKILANISYIRKDEKSYYKYNNQGKNIYPKECFDILEKRKFLGREIWFPSNPELFFTSVYGKDWKIPKNTKQVFHSNSNYKRNRRIITRTVFTYNEK